MDEINLEKEIYDKNINSDFLNTMIDLSNDNPIYCNDLLLVTKSIYDKYKDILLEISKTSEMVKTIFEFIEADAELKDYSIHNIIEPLYCTMLVYRFFPELRHPPILTYMKQLHNILLESYKYTNANELDINLYEIYNISLDWLHTFLSIKLYNIEVLDEIFELENIMNFDFIENFINERI